MNSKLILSKIDTITFATFFFPAFEESSVIKLVKIDTIINLQILISNNEGVDKSQDTFYYKVKSISQNEFNRIDTSLINKTKTKYSQKQRIGFDGMNIFFELIEKGDTSRIGFWSPNKEDELFGYEMTNDAINNFKILFDDEIIIDYFDDLETYIDESKFSALSKKKRKIDKLRETKYNLYKNNPRY